ncbi:MAG TPA: carboxypeptidase-like regulatory domain-containing protein [Balneolales bacterium]|nr:carboxypeptidase-like regulatory domain-containing protein [Balneolales bacterium]
MIKRAFFSTLLLTLIVGFTYMNSNAQATETNTKAATLKGMVVDASSGNPIADIEVQLKGTDNSTMTDSTGYFEFTDLEAGSFTLYVDADGYKEYEQTVDLTEEGAQVTIKLEQAMNDDEEDSSHK